MNHNNYKLDQELDDITFVILDLETTGLKARFKDRIVEIGAIKMFKGEVVDRLDSLINPLRPLTLGAFNVNKIKHTMLENAPIFEKFSPKLLEFIKDSVIVAYNAPFDISFLEKEFNLLNIPAKFSLPIELNRQSLEYLKIPDLQLPLKLNVNTCDQHYLVVDVLVLIKNIFSKLPMYKQSYIANFLGINRKPIHRALGDAYTTLEIFNVVIQILKNFGCNKLKDLINPGTLIQKISTYRIEKLKAAILNRNRISIDYININTNGFRKYNIFPVSFDSNNIMLEAVIDNYTEHFFIDRIFNINVIK